MAANHNGESNGESNGGFRIRWKTLPVIIATIIAISTGIGGYALSKAESATKKAESATKIEMRCTAAEKRLDNHEKIISVLRDGQADTRGDLKKIATDLEWIKKNMEKRHP